MTGPHFKADAFPARPRNVLHAFRRRMHCYPTSCPRAVGETVGPDPQIPFWCVAAPRRVASNFVSAVSRISKAFVALSG